MATKRWISTSSTAWSTAGNWSPSGVPATGDDVYIDAVGTANIDTGLGQSAVTLASLNISSTYTGTIGTASGTYLAISATLLNIGTASNDGTTGSGSGRIMIDTGSNASTVTIYSTSTVSSDTGVEPVRLLGAHASNIINVLSGRVGIATNAPGETSTFPVVSVVGENSYLDCGAGVTLTTVTNNGGTLTTNTAITTLSCYGGTTTAWGSVAITTCNAYGGTVNIYNRNGGTCVTTLNWDGANVNFRGQPKAITIGTTAIKRGGTCSVYSSSQVTWGTVTFDPTYTVNVAITTDPI